MRNLYNRVASQIPRNTPRTRESALFVTRNAPKNCQPGTLQCCVCSAAAISNASVPIYILMQTHATHPKHHIPTSGATASPSSILSYLLCPTCSTDIPRITRVYICSKRHATILVMSNANRNGNSPNGTSDEGGDRSGQQFPILSPHTMQSAGTCSSTDMQRYCRTI